MPAADTEVKSNNLNVRQSQVIESINDLDDSTICLRLETDHQLHVEEANQFNILGRLFKLFDFYSLSSFSKFWKNSRKYIFNFNEPKEAVDVLGCNEQSFEYHSKVDKPCAASDTEVKSNKLNFRQSQVIESINNSIESTICLGSNRSPISC
jgi:hypothetical protein